MRAEQYLILSLKRPSDYLVFYRPEASGYTNNVADAGRYSAEEAARHCDGIDYLIAIPESHIGSLLKTRTVIDTGDNENWRHVKAMREAKRADAIARAASGPEREDKDRE